MKNPALRLILAIVLGVTFVNPLPSVHGDDFPEFESHHIANWGSRMGQTSLVDIDRDGDLDWVVGQSGRMAWFEYRGPEDWQRHPMGQGARTDVGGTAFDIDGDGWIDQFSGTGWYRNPTEPRLEPFTFFESGTISSHDNVAADIDGDGRLDVVACSNDPKHVQLVWYTIPVVPTTPWIEHPIGPGIHGGVDPAGVGDLDGDEDADVVRGDVWFENLDRHGTQWQQHNDFLPLGGSRVGQFGLALKTWVHDLDRDGDLDVVEAEADFEDGRVFWFENLGRAKAWERHLISAQHTRQDFHSLALADFDGDFDMDVFSGGGPLTADATHRWFIWENLDGEGGQWRQHEVLTGKRCHEAKAADVDQDGDIDICAKPWRGDEHLYLRNLLMESKGASR